MLSFLKSVHKWRSYSNLKFQDDHFGHFGQENIKNFFAIMLSVKNDSNKMPSDLEFSGK